MEESFRKTVFIRRNYNDSGMGLNYLPVATIQNFLLLDSNQSALSSSINMRNERIHIWRKCPAHFLESRSANFLHQVAPMQHLNCSPIDKIMVVLIVMGFHELSAGSYSPPTMLGDTLAI